MNGQNCHSGQENGDSDQLVEIYKVQIQSADRISNRRATLTRHYIIVMFGLITGAFTLIQNYSAIPSELTEIFTYRTITIAGSIIGILLSWTWFVQIDRYLQLNSRKFNVLKDLETKLKYQFYGETLQGLGEQDRQKSYWKRAFYHLSMPSIFFFIFLLTLTLGAFGLPWYTKILLFIVPILLGVLVGIRIRDQRHVESSITN